MDSEIVNSSRTYHINCKWFIFNYSKFKEQYREKFVAVYNEKIIDSDTDFEKLMNRLVGMKIDVNAVFTMYVRKESGYLIRVTKLI